ncbi:hypothetical protein LCL87_03540 [Rhodococcus hoagii]|nr:hypothetical protein [Prescottella equi]
MAVDRLPELAYKGPCPALVDDAREHAVRHCGADLYAEKGQDWVKCRRCGSNHDVREINRAAREHVVDMLFTATELHGLLEELGSPVPKGTIWSWASRRQLHPRGWRRNGRITDHWIHRNDPPVYRLADVLELANRPHCPPSGHNFP